MTSLTSCPPEIVRDIFSRLDKANLVDLCRVSQYLCSIAQPLLYHVINIKFHTYPDAHSAPDPAPFIPLTTTLLRRPDLAANVWAVNIGHDWDKEEQVKYPVKSPVKGRDDAHLINELAAFVLRAARGTPISFRHRWISGLEKGFRGAYIALLLALVPNIQTCHIRLMTPREYGLLGLMFDYALCSRGPDIRLPRFERLREVTFNQVRDIPAGELPEWWEPRYNEKDHPDWVLTEPNLSAKILPLFYLPAVERLHLAMDDPECDEVPWPGYTACAPSCETLESLTLVASREYEGIREGLLGQILSATKILQHLSWLCLDNQAAHPERSFINLDQFATDLCAVRTSLKSLQVTADARASTWDYDQEHVVLRGNMLLLKTFNSLTDLRIPLVFLFGFSPPPPSQNQTTARLADFLPPSLVSVFLTGDLYVDQRYSWTIQSKIKLIEDWFRVRETTTPYLTKFAMRLGLCEEDSASSQCRNRWRWLRRRLAQHGIKLVLQRSGWSDSYSRHSDPVEDDDTEPETESDS